MSYILQERHKDASYRVDQHPSGGLTLEYTITVYPPSNQPITVGVYRYDAIPEWLRECMAMIDAAHPEPVYDMGKRIGQTYWVEPRRPSFIAMLHSIQDAAKQAKG